MSDEPYIRLILIQRLEHWRDRDNYDADTVEETYLYAGDWADAKAIVDRLNFELEERRGETLAVAITQQKKTVAEHEARYTAQTRLSDAEQKLLGIDSKATKGALDFSKSVLSDLERDREGKKRYRKEGESYWTLDACPFATNFYFEPHVHTGEPTAVFKPDFKVEN